MCLENQNLNYDWCLTYLSQGKFIVQGSERIFNGKLSPEVITFKDCFTSLEIDFSISIPNCKVLNIVSTEN